MSFPFRETLWAADEFKPFTLSEKSKINSSVLNPWNLSCLLSSLIRLSLMETDSLSCLRSVGASVPFTFPDVLFQIYSLNLDSLTFDTGCAWTEKSCTFLLLLFTCRCFVFLLQSNLCNTVGFGVHIVVAACRHVSDVWAKRWKNLSPSSAGFC